MTSILLMRIQTLTFIFLVALGYPIGIHAAQPAVVQPKHGEPKAPEEYPEKTLLVSTEQLDVFVRATQQVKKDFGTFIIIDARNNSDFASGHIPGAFNIDSDLLQDPTNKPFYLPAKDVFEKLSKSLGIHPDSQIIIYDAHAGRLAARIWFALWAYGHDHVCILNGGLQKWRFEKKALATENPGTAAKEGTWEPLDQPRDTIAHVLIKGYQAPPPAVGHLPMSTILDARTFQEYKGEDARAKSGGHIPGAVNIPFDTMMKPVVPRDATEKEGYFVWHSPQHIHALLRAAGLLSHQPICVYCQSGGRAAHLFFTLKLMGYKQVVSYSGGWREYGDLEGVEVER